MWVECSEPEEKRLVLWACFEHRHPLVAPTAGIADHFLYNFTLLSRLTGGQLKTGHVGLAHLVKLIFNRIAQMPLAGRCGPVTRGLEKLNECQSVSWQWPVQLLGISLVRVGAGDDARAAGTA